MPDTEVIPVIQEKQSWQKVDCLFCGEPAEFEAFASQGNLSSHIRCCKSPICQDMAKKWAVEGATGHLSTLSGLAE